MDEKPAPPFTKSWFLAQREIPFRPAKKPRSKPGSWRLLRPGNSGAGEPAAQRYETEDRAAEQCGGCA